VKQTDYYNQNLKPNLMTRQGLEAVGRSGLAEEWGRLAEKNGEKSSSSP